MVTDHVTDSRTASWALWPNESQRSLSIEHLIDQAFKDYLFYPEPEWAHFGYRPPENYPLLSAWRDSEGKVFLFLLDHTTQRPINSPRQLLLYVSGKTHQVDSIEKIILSLKTYLTKLERKELREKNIDNRLDSKKGKNSVQKLLGLIGLFTAIINGFSLYLRNIPVPSFSVNVLNKVYELLLSVIHISSLILLLLTILLCIFYVLQYGFLLLRRL